MIKPAQVPAKTIEAILLIILGPVGGEISHGCGSGAFCCIQHASSRAAVPKQAPQMTIHAHCSEFGARLSIVLNVRWIPPATSAPRTSTESRSCCAAVQ